MSVHGSLWGVHSRRFSSIALPLLAAGASLLLNTSAMAADWPRWRGPLNSGEALDEPPITSLPTSPAVVWQTDIGEGFSSPVVAGGNLAIMDAESGREMLRVLAAADGKPLWKADIDEVFKDSQGPPAPRNTPVLDGDRVYAVSCRGELQCRSIVDGKQLWRTRYTEDLGAVFIGEKGTAPGATRHGNNASPLIDGPHLIAPVGGTNGHSIVAFDKLKGNVVWHSQNDMAGYGAPVVATAAGVRQVIAFTVDGVIGLRRDTGELLWRIPVKTAFSRHVMTPVVWQNMVIAGSHQAGLIGIRLTPENGGVRAEQAWVSKEAAPNFAHPVSRDQFLYTLGPARNIQCVDMLSGAVRWSQEGLVTTSPDKAYAGFVRVRDRMLMLADSGEIALFKAEPEKAEVLGRAQVCGVTWANPAYADGVLYLRDGIKGRGKLMALRLR